VGRTGDHRSAIKDIIRSDWPNPDFAFSSACYTTVGDGRSPNEPIHLVAAIQFSGFRIAIGFVQSVDDNAAGEIGFYDNLVDVSDCMRAAVALHKAMKSLRKKDYTGTGDCICSHRRPIV